MFVAFQDTNCLKKITITLRLCYTGQQQRTKNSCGIGNTARIDPMQKQIERSSRIGLQFACAFVSTNTHEVIFQPVDSRTRTYNRRVGSWRLAKRPCVVGQDWLPTELCFFSLSKASKTCRLNVAPEAEGKPTAAVDPRTRSALFSCR